MSTVVVDRKSPVPPSDALYEVVDGEIVEKSVSTYAALLAMRLLFSLKAHLDVHSIGMPVIETVFLLDAERGLRRRPDVAVVAAEDWAIDRLPPVQGDWSLAPLISVEVASPNDGLEDSLRKIREYFDYGVREVWLISPENRIVHVYTAPDSVRILTAADHLQTPLIPGWSIDVGDLIPVPTPA